MRLCSSVPVSISGRAPFFLASVEGLFGAKGWPRQSRPASMRCLLPSAKDSPICAIAGRMSPRRRCRSSSSRRTWASSRVMVRALMDYTGNKGVRQNLLADAEGAPDTEGWWGH